MKKRQIDQCIRHANRVYDTHPIWNHPSGKPKFFHYTYIFQNGKLITEGYNHFGDAPPYYPDNAMVHSEVHAIKRGKNKLDMNTHFEIFNIRMNKHRKLLMSKPCKICHHVLLDPLGCSKAYFTTDTGIAEIKF